MTDSRLQFGAHRRLGRRGKTAGVLALALLAAAGVQHPFASDAFAPTSGYDSAVTVPEHPEGQSFNPTQIKDIQAASPAAGIKLIEAPVANNQGDARLGYALEVPPGRQGVQPDLALTYSSSGAQSWTGLGWDLSAPSITIDTRWGVPRYDAQLETETYLFGGEQLTPVAHRGAPKPRSSEKVFRSRVEGSFHRIVRHGASPSTYTWEVTTKDGTTMTYGALPGAVLADDKGNRAVWALTEVRDLNDNFMRYHYSAVSDAGVAGSSVLGRELYLARITYTGSGSAEGRYSVTFVRDRERGEARRKDVAIDARLGFKRVGADLLRRIEVKLDDDLVRAYELDYTTGAFGKTLLASVTQLGSGNERFHTHTFDYFDDIRDAEGGYQAFAQAAGWTVPDDGLGRSIGGSEGEAGALSSSTSATHSGHFYAGWNPVSVDKDNSGGVKAGHSFSQSDGLLALADLNGDNLPDKVFRSSGDIYYRPNLSGPNGQATFGAAVKLPSLPAISREQSISGTAGLESYFGRVNAQVDYTYTRTTSDRYLLDVNGDGISDLVKNGGVLFGHLGADGTPTYTHNSADTPVPVGPGAVAGDVLGDQTAEFEQLVKAFPLLDSVRRWVAPFDGTVRVDGGVRLAEDLSVERAEYAQADGVRVTIQHEDDELWAKRIGPDDHVEYVPSGTEEIIVKKGDALYFRVQSVLDGRFDDVTWDPRVSYRDLTATTDVNGLDSLTYRASTDFTLAGRPSSVVAPLTGTLHISGDAGKSGPTSDDVAVEVLRNGTPVLAHTLAAASAGSAPVDLDVAVTEGDTLSFRMGVDSPVDVRTLTWAPRAAYTSAEGVDVVDATGRPTVELSVPHDVDLYPASTLTAPQVAWTAASESLSVQPHLTFDFAGASPDSEVVFTVKKRGDGSVPGALVAKRTIQIVDGELGPIPAVPVTVQQGDELFFDFTTRDPSLLRALTHQSVSVGDETVPSALHAPVEHSAANDVFAQPYRGWAAVGYQGNEARATEPIHQADLVLREPTRKSAVTEADVPVDGEFPQVETPKVVVFAPVPAEGRWGGADENTWVAAGSASSSRLGVDTLDVRSDAAYAGGTAVERKSRTTQLSTSLGAGSVNASKARGKSQGRIDFLDLNGDQFPDVVGSGIQYSDMVGGLGATRGSLGGQVRQSQSDSYTVSGGAGAYARTSADARGQSAPSGDRTAKSAQSGSGMLTLGVSGSLGGGDSDTEYDLLDINGDGLPDKVFAGGDAALNLGYSFGPREPWGAGAVNDGGTRNASIGGNAGFNQDFYEFAGGVSASLGTSWTDASLQDMNGDGLLDRVLTRDGQPVAVGLNTGGGFAAPTPFGGARDDIAIDDNATLGAGVYFTWGFCTGYAGCFVFNMGGDDAVSVGRSEVALRDVNGDGYVDHVRSTKDDELVVSENRTGRTNLLRTVERPLGATISLDYARSGNTTDQPGSRWVLSRSSVHDGHAGDGQDTQVAAFTYRQGVYDRLEREFLGYGSVTTRELNPGNDATYRATKVDYRTDSYYAKGLPTRTLTSDSADRPYVDTRSTYQLRDVATGEPADAKSTSSTVFPMLTRQETRFHEGQAEPGKTTYTEMEYDSHGNLVRTLDAGDDGAADDLETLVGYTSDATCAGKHLVGVPTSSRARHDGVVLRRSEASLDCGTGNVTQVRAYLADGRAAVTDLTYFPDGNLKGVVEPANQDGERSSTTYAYDTGVQTHVEKIVDQFGYSTTVTHDLRFGQSLVTTDENGQQLKQGWDNLGRLTSVTGPYEVAGGRATIAFEYHPEAGTPYALTRHVDRAADGVRDDTIDTALFTDGLGRAIQTKKDASVAPAAGQEPVDVMTVSGRTTYDFAGRVIEQRYPVTEAIGTASTFNVSVDPVAPTRTAYDVMDRTVQSTLPDNSVTKQSHGFAADRSGATRFLTVTTDANGKQRHTFADVRGRTTAAKEFNPAGGQPVIWTSYVHDPLGQIAKVVDDRGNQTLTEYDALGRRTAVVSPDSGRTESRYDLAGHLVAKVTAKLAPLGKSIQYDYDYNRLAGIRYPIFTGNNVTFTYGAPGAADNTANRVAKVTDAAGTLTRAYGPLGEVVRETRQVTAIRTPARTYTTAYRFDAFNRVLDMTYPDGERLTYEYDSGGLVHRATGVKGADDYTYLARLDYDKFGQRVLQETGTGVRTTYAYDAADRELTNLASTLPDGYRFQNLTYTYDSVGNVRSLTNAVVQQDGKPVGGASQQTFGYDDLYRLTTATGKYQKSDNKVDSYEMALSYDTIHNTLTKSQQHQITVGETWTPTVEDTATTTEPTPLTLEDGTTYYPPLGVIEEPEPTDEASTDPVIDPVTDPVTEDASAGPTGTTTEGATTEGTATDGPTTDGATTDGAQSRVQVQRDTTYDYAYTYGSRPHAPSKVGPNEHTFDVNGNLVDEVNTLPPAPGKRRQFVWDEDNRLACNQDHSRNATVAQAPASCSTPKQPPTVRYVYDSAGERVVKDSGQVSIYPNRAFSERNGTGFKHVFVGDDRLATKTVKPDSTYENHQFFFHDDHLGSSAFVTDEHGALTEHMEYFAFGETWVEEHPAQPTAMPYQYGGKELDDETGLYYYGARYYNPRTQLWASPDPILESYLDGKPNGGVYASANLASYSYAYNNPVRYTDPDGRQTRRVGTPMPMGNDPTGGAGAALGQMWMDYWTDRTFYNDYKKGKTTAVQAAKDIYYLGSGGTTSIADELRDVIRADDAALTNARNRGVARAKSAEKKLVQLTGKGTRAWTPAEIALIQAGGWPGGYEGHHRNSVEAAPELADIADNVEFLKAGKEHLDAHGGAYQNRTSAPLLNRGALMAKGWTIRLKGMFAPKARQK